MKKYTLIFALISTLYSFSQSWKFESGNNVFDGNFRTAYVNGKGTDYPYNNPVLAINLYNESSLNFYIANAGYFQSESYTKIYWVFDNEPNVIYETENPSSSKDKKTIFLEKFKVKQTNQYISQFKFINKLKQSNKVSVRISDNYGNNDIVFQLLGSSKAIDFVINGEYEKSMLLIEKENEFKAKETVLKSKDAEATILKYLSSIGLTIEEEVAVLTEIDYHSKKLEYLDYSEIDSLTFVIKNMSVDLDFYNSNHILFYSIRNIGYAVPKYASKSRKLKETKEFESKTKNLNRVLQFLEKDGLIDPELNTVSELIIEESELYSSFEISEIDSFTIVLPSKFINYSSLIFLNKKKSKIYSIKKLKNYAPNYLDKYVVERNKLSKKTIHKYLSAYNLTEEELVLVNNKLNTVQLFNFDPINISKCEVEFNDRNKLQSIFKFINSKGGLLYKLEIIDKGFTKSMKSK